MAASRGYTGGWVHYDEQFRLRKVFSPFSSWGVVDMELWLLCVSTPNVSPSFNTGLSNGNNLQLHSGHSSTSYTHLYSLGNSPINVDEVKKALKNYPYQEVARDLIQGLETGFKLKYSGPRLPMDIDSKELIGEKATIARDKIFKEINLEVPETMPHSRCKPTHDSGPSMESLKDEADLLLKCSMASNSWKTYKTAVECFKKFRFIYNYRDIWPVPIDEIAQFIAYLSYKGFSASTVSTYISGLAHTHKINNITDNTKSFIISKMIEGLRRKNPQKLDVRTPISFDLLKRLIHSLRSVCNSQYETLLFSSAFSLAYFAMLRVSELAINSRTDESGHALKCEDVTFDKSNGQTELHVKLCSSKTDQKHNSITLIIQSHADSNICPIRLLQSYLQVRFSGVNGSNKLYTHFNGSKAIWFVGSSIVYWAQTNAKTRHGGPNIGLQSRGVYIRWFGKRGMLWNDFNAKVLHAVEKFSPPAMIVIQLGSNDLVKVKTLELIQNIERDILRLHLLLPNTRIVWSEMLMRRYWHGATDGKAIERSRKRVNSAINNYVLNDGHCVIQHPNIRAQELNLYRYDGTHLSDIGYNIYLNNIQGGIETFLSSPKIRRFPEV
ncbi:unnamed protein product [Mytilus edulis]|uniref:Uncharacterized protein n=1 Tax=Mytilus edulis TaxID=6550 RepID=A0A8S3RL11_MYTED|nr:unnamed protein product [Mytilus edulis]